MRTQPWEAGYPGRMPACMPDAPSKRMNHFIGAGTNMQPFGTGMAESAPALTRRPEAFSTILP